jgi:hypothetical protein
MKRADLEHVIRAAAAISKDPELIIVGSQAILGQFPDAPDELLVSVEADVYPKNAPQLADLIDGSIGELSPFHETFGYYAQGVGPETAKLPLGWEARLVKVQNANTHGAIGWCLEVHDLALSKYAAGREKDLAFTRVLARNALVQRATLEERAQLMALDAAVQTLILQRIAADFSAVAPRS